MESFLKDRSYYENLYDQNTIKFLKDKEKSIRPKIKKWEPDFTNFLIYFYKMSRYENREAAIIKRIQRDKEKDNFINNTKPPISIVRCKFCNVIMELESKDFFSWYENKPHELLFIYRCQKCRKWRWFYNNWNELESLVEKCRKCWEIIKYKWSYKDHILTKEYNCNKCWEKYSEIEDYSTSLSIKDEEITQEDMLKYWYSEKEAYDMRQVRVSLDNMWKALDKIKERDKDKEFYEQINKLSKYNLSQIENYIIENLDKKEFSNFKINSSKQYKTYLICEFNVYYNWTFWNNAGRKFEKILEQMLYNTNWSISRGYLTEKLWVITWIINWYDDEKDLLELIKKRKMI